MTPVPNMDVEPKSTRTLPAFMSANNFFLALSVVAHWINCISPAEPYQLLLYVAVNVPFARLVGGKVAEHELCATVGV